MSWIWMSTKNMENSPIKLLRAHEWKDNANRGIPEHLKTQHASLWTAAQYEMHNWMRYNFGMKSRWSIQTRFGVGGHTRQNHRRLPFLFYVSAFLFLLDMWRSGVIPTSSWSLFRVECSCLNIKYLYCDGVTTAGEQNITLKNSTYLLHI